MRKHVSRAFRATVLAYSSPAVDTTSSASTCFYNAFPDLNDEAPDGSRSTFPHRAKYLLALDSEFLPSGMWVESNNIEQDRLASLDSGLREVIAAVIDKYGHQNPLLCLPRTQELNETFRFQRLSEIPHKRLAATDYKWALRTYLLAPFYTTLENHLVRGEKIRVPLVPSHHGSRLQRHWAAVFGAFQPTLLLDEVATLLICVTLLPPAERNAHEEAWMAEEASEIRDFADYYRKLRDRFNPECCVEETDKRALAEKILEYTKGALAARTVKNVSLAEEVYLNLGEKKRGVSWPSLLGEEVHRGLRQLHLRNDLVLGRVGARISIPEAMQWLMALFSVLDDEEQSFVRKDALWPEYVEFSLEIGEDSSYPRISIGLPSHMLALALLGIKKADGSYIDPLPNSAPVGTLLAGSICRYTIFLESIRQQICTGVGLRCPFWKGSGCCEFRPLLQRTYEACKPSYPPWKHHWQRPPCLG